MDTLAAADKVAAERDVVRRHTGPGGRTGAGGRAELAAADKVAAERGVVRRHSSSPLSRRLDLVA
ncbi:hypothetical protein [Nocardioides sp. P5_C9_2]